MDVYKVEGREISKVIGAFSDSTSEGVICRYQLDERIDFGSHPVL
jgi:hypothetical protein